MKIGLKLKNCCHHVDWVPPFCVTRECKREGGEEPQTIAVWRGVSKRVEDGCRPLDLPAGCP
jgi:hypothetical protein